MQNYQSPELVNAQITIKPYAGSEKPAAGNRLATILFRSKPGEAKKQNMYAEIPVLDLPPAGDSVPAAIQQYMQDAINNLQDAVIRDLYDEGKTTFSLAAIDWQGLADYAAATKASTKLSKAAIEAWFDEQLAPTIAEKAAAKQGIADVSTATPEQLATIEKLLDTYKAAFAKLAAVAPKIAIDDAKALKQLASHADQENGITKQLVSRLDAIITPSSLGLGDLGL